MVLQVGTYLQTPKLYALNMHSFLYVIHISRKWVIVLSDFPREM